MKEYKLSRRDSQTQNKQGEWVPAIPEPYYHLLRKECYMDNCHEKFWTILGYRSHFALRHIMGL